MSERKVLNKYYPPDFDPSKIPKLKLPKDRQYVVRLMAPFNMRCKTCGEYIYKGKKFNARKETVQNEAYLGLPIFRFYIKCTRCLAEITFKTDPENTDYTMEHGATRNFQAEKLLEEEEKRVQKEREDEELNNPMKVLENRTKDSKLEMEVLENLQELKDLNQRQAHVDFEAMLRQHRLSEEERQKQEQEEDERETAALVEEARKRRLLEDSDSEEDAPASAPPRLALRPKPTAILDECWGNREDFQAALPQRSRTQLFPAPAPPPQSISSGSGVIASTACLVSGQGGGERGAHQGPAAQSPLATRSHREPGGCGLLLAWPGLAEGREEEDLAASIFQPAVSSTGVKAALVCSFKMRAEVEREEWSSPQTHFIL